MAVIKRQTLTSDGEDVEKMEPLDMADGYVKWWYHFGMQVGINSKSLMAITLLGINPRDLQTRVCTKTCT